MANSSENQQRVRRILKEYGQTYAAEIGIQLKNTPSALFQLLYSALLMSARIPAKNAVSAAKALREAGLTTPQKMAQASWQDRVDVITWHGYKRYDERTATMLGECAERLLENYGGDLRKLRDAADRDVEREQELLQQFKGIGPVGTAIFLREAQGIWKEVFPFADKRVLQAAKKLKLPSSAAELAKLVKPADFPRFVAGLVRHELNR